MKKALKVTFGAILAAGLASTAFAGESDVLNRGAVWVTGTWTEISNNGVSYGDLVQTATAGTSDGQKRHVFIDPDMEFDYALGFSQHFCGTKTRGWVTYDHFSHAEDSSNTNVRNIGSVPTPATPTFATGNVQNHSDEVRFGLTRTMDFMQGFSLDVSGFFEWDQVKRTIDEAISGPVAGSFAARTTYERVQGWGPGIGARARSAPFRCASNIGFFMGGNATLIWADDQFESSLVDDGALVYLYDPEQTETIVGKIDISFGIDYSRCMRDFGGTILDIALGVKYMNMFNAFKNGNAYQNPVYIGSGGFAYSANLGTSNDFGRVGPFLTFALGGGDA